MKKKDKRKERKIRYSSPRKVIDNKEKGWSPTAFKVPDGMEMFKFKEAKKYRIDVLPYKVKSNPWADVEKGDYHYERTYYVHGGMGATGQDKYCCLQKNFNKPCPICKHGAKLKAGGAAKDVLSQFYPKERQLFVIIDRDSDDKKLQLFETAHYKSFGEMLANKLDGADEDSPMQSFHSLDDGMYLSVKTKQDSFAGNTYYPPINIEMNPRSKPLPESLLEEIPCLDDVFIELTYKELEKIFNQVTSDAEEEDGDDEDKEDDEEDDEEDKPKKKKKGKADDEDDEDSDDEDDSDDGSDDDDGDEDEADDDDDNEEDEIDWDDKVGDKVKFKKGGKTKEGVFVKKKGDTGVVKIKGVEGTIKVPLDKLTLVEAPDDDDDDSDDDDWD